MLCSLRTTYGRYVLNRGIILQVSTADYYFTATAEQTEYISTGQVTGTININNYENDNYTNVNITYTVEASNNTNNPGEDKYDIEIEDEGKGVLTGGSKTEKQITITATPKAGITLNEEERIKVTIQTQAPYEDTKEIEFIIDTRERYYNINYELDGGELPTNHPTEYDSTIGVTLVEPTKVGYEFTGWTGSNGSVPQVNVTIPAESTGEKTYTANWAKAYYQNTTTNKYYATLNSAFTNSVTNTQINVLENTTETLDSVLARKRNNFKFKWSYYNINSNKYFNYNER